MYCASCEVQTEFIYVMSNKVDHLCGLVVRVPGYITEMYCAPCEVQTEFICYVEQSRPPLWTSGQVSWLQIQRLGFDSRHYQVFWEVVDLERGPLSPVSTNEELFERKSSGSGLEKRKYGSRDPPLWLRDIPLTAKMSTNFPDKRCSPADWRHGVLSLLLIYDRVVFNRPLLFYNSLQLSYRDISAF
jgi:hypothetical protein